jgi:hypothetical protein
MQVRACENEKKYHWFIHTGKTPAGTIAGTGFVNCLLTPASFLRVPGQSFRDVAREEQRLILWENNLLNYVKFNFFYLTYIMQVLILLTSAYSFHIGYYGGTFFGLVALGLTLIPTLVHRKVHIVVPWEVTFLIALTLFLHIGGYSYHWYLDLYPWFDKVTHLIASMTIALLGFLAVLIMMRVSTNLQLERWQIFFFIVIFTLAFGAIWEIWEFTLDTFASAYLSKPLQQGNTDTMLDLIADLGGGLIIAFLGAHYLKKKSAEDWADTFLEPGFGVIAARFQR